MGMNFLVSNYLCRLGSDAVHVLKKKTLHRKDVWMGSYWAFKKLLVVKKYFLPNC